MPDQIQDAAEMLSRFTPEQRKRMTMDHRVKVKSLAIFLQKTWSQVAFVFIWIISLQFISLFFFTKGFLLSRPVLDNHSSCFDIPSIFESDIPSDTSGSEIFSKYDITNNDLKDSRVRGGCWHPKTFDRAVLLVVDALRFDFTIPGPNSTKQYLNNMPFMYENSIANPENSLLLKFIADPPTTTLQRLKGLTTGSLPTFIDAGSNFAGTEILEDSWLAQFAALNNNSIAFAGDDTWMALFSNLFNDSMTYPYESLNVMDLHTVDNGVKTHLVPFIESPELSDNWKLAIGHMLGVDHAGHRYGPEHPSMSAKQKETDEFIRSVSELIDDDTLLIVMGDHGMDPKGDHGGESQPELEAALWMYSKKPVWGRLPDVNNTVYDARNYGNMFRSVSQIDLVPTLSLLLGIPIPYNNLGFPIDEAFLGTSSINTPEKTDYSNLAHAKLLTAAQIRRYSLLDGSLLELENVNSLWNALVSSVSSSSAEDPSFEKIISAASAYHSTVLNEYRTLWVQFDVVSMTTGLALMAASAIIIYIYARVMPTELDEMTSPLLRAVSGLSSAFGVIFWMVSRLASTKTFVDSNGITTTIAAAIFPSVLRSPVSGLLLGIGLGSTIGFFGFFASVFYKGVSFSSFVSMFLIPKSSAGILALGLTIAHSLLFASNSYTVLEDTSLLFLLATLGVYFLLISLRATSRTSKLFASSVDGSADDSDTSTGSSHSIANSGTSTPILTSADFEQKAKDDRRKVLAIYFSVAFLVTLRFISYSKVCREEQGLLCKTTFYINQNSTVSSWISIGLLAFASLFLPTVVSSFYETSASMNGAAPGWITYGLRTIMFIISAYWALDGVDSRHYITDEWGVEQLRVLKITIARIVLGITLAAANYVWWNNSLCVKIEMIRGPSSFSEKTGNIPGSASYKGPLQAKILGYSNAYGSMIMLSVLNFFAATLILSKPMAGLSLCGLLFQILTVLELFDIFETHLYFSSLGPVVFGLLGSFHFFTTGHQATIPSVQWDIAYIPAQSIVFPFTHIALIFNTFAPQILTSLAVPLLVLWKVIPSKTPSPLMRLVSRTGLTLILYQTVITFSAMFFAMHFRRHLMVWKIFAPRFMLAGIALCVTDVVVFLSTIFIAGHTIKYINKVFNT